MRFSFIIFPFLWKLFSNRSLGDIALKFSCSHQNLIVVGVSVGVATEIFVCLCFIMAWEIQIHALYGRLIQGYFFVRATLSYHSVIS
ncbi:hypothetical protein CKAN_00260400 [Cinnamomum micranthum f. kanehirae]|uniref:Uncharacterized protein n=1 Tax=Cinnamomum micranthum f. kanehirae TaxID=337451 RepID=A0A3S3MIE0_9MAGN|nr:hypothetical protein CKAN_00260400 [Cinnamomum micranthum f. kanehirae]